jgi:hypothetical protein
MGRVERIWLKRETWERIAAGVETTLDPEIRVGDEVTLDD